MKRYSLLLVLFLVLVIPKTFAGFTIHSTTANSTVLSYEHMKVELSGYKWQPTPLKYENNAVKHKKCLVSKIGRGTMMGGGAAIVGGMYWALTDKHNGESFYIPPGLGFVLLGLLAVGLGGLLAIGGGIYNALNNRGYTLISRRPNEVGVAYNFR